MSAFDSLAERRIAAAIERGELDDLPGAGQPLALDDDPLVPPDLRMAHRILRNAGMVPPEVEALRSVADLERALLAADDDAARRRAVRRLDCLLARLDRRPATSAVRDYHDRLLERFDRTRE